MTRFAAALHKLITAARSYPAFAVEKDLMTLRALFAQVQLAAPSRVTIPPFCPEIWRLYDAELGPVSQDHGQSWHMEPSYRMRQHGSMDARDRWVSELEAIAEAVESAAILSAAEDIESDEATENGSPAETTKDARCQVETPSSETPADAASPPSLDSTGNVSIIWFHGGESYSVDGGNPVNVSRETHNVLKMYLDNDRSLATSALENNGVTNVSKVMKNIARKFGENVVRWPRNKGDGYYLRVRTKTPTR